MYPDVESQACVPTGMGASFLEHLRLISKKRGMSSLQTTLAILVMARRIRKSACMLRTSVVRLEHWGVVVLSPRGRSEVADSGKSWLSLTIPTSFVDRDSRSPRGKRSWRETPLTPRRY